MPSPNSSSTHRSTDLSAAPISLYSTLDFAFVSWHASSSWSSASWPVVIAPSFFKTLDYFLSGSMNLTLNGISVNGEHLVLRTDPATVAEQALELASQWEGLLA